MTIKQFAALVDQRLENLRNELAAMEACVDDEQQRELLLTAMSSAMTKDIEVVEDEEPKERRFIGWMIGTAPVWAITEEDTDNMWILVENTGLACCACQLHKECGDRLLGHEFCHLRKNINRGFWQSVRAVEVEGVRITPFHGRLVANGEIAVTELSEEQLNGIDHCDLPVPPVKEEPKTPATDNSPVVEEPIVDEPVVPKKTVPVLNKDLKVYRYRGINILTVTWATGLYVSVPTDQPCIATCPFKDRCDSTLKDCNILMEPNFVWEHLTTFVCTDGVKFSAPNGFLRVEDGDVDDTVLEPLTEDELKQLEATGRIDRPQSEPLDMTAVVEAAVEAVECPPTMYSINNRMYMVWKGKLLFRTAAHGDSCDGCTVEGCPFRNGKTPSYCRNAANQRRIWHALKEEGVDKGAKWYNHSRHYFVLQPDDSLLYYKNGYTHRHGDYSIDGFVKLKKV